MPHGVGGGAFRPAGLRARQSAIRRAVLLRRGQRLPLRLLVARSKARLTRQNPRVCLEIDTVNGAAPTTSSKNAPCGWEPGTVTIEGRDPREGCAPAFLRISIEHTTGHRGVPAPKGARE